MSRERRSPVLLRVPKDLPEGHDYSLFIIQALVDYVEDTYGREALEQAVLEAGWTLHELRHGPGWYPFERFDALHRALRARLASEDEHRRAVAHRYKESFGPFVFFVRTLSPRVFYQRVGDYAGMVSRCARFECLEASETRAVLRYSSVRNEGRLSCVARQGQMMVVPEVFGSPPARLEERSCVCRGDPFCEYVLTWQEHFRPLAPAVGLLVGIGACVATLLVWRGHPAAPVVFLLPVLGTALGWVHEVSRLYQARRRAREEVSASVRELAAQAAEARDEVLALLERQAEWVSALEQQADERTSALRAVIAQVQHIREQQAVDLRGFSHDLRNPLSVVRMYQKIMQEHAQDWGLDEADRALLAQMEGTLGQIDGLLEGLLRDAMREVSRGQPVLESLEVAPLVDGLRRRLKALVLGREVRVEVSAKREAPERIRTDVLVFDGVVDALLTHAAKQTERGLIRLELDGSPGMLCLRVADTGAGIAKERIEEVLVGESERTKELGLSGPVRLLGQIGGRLEVMSQPGVGTTFCAWMPAGQ